MKTIFCILFFIIHSQAQENWNIVNSGTTDNLTDVCFIGNQYGWIIGISGTLLRTTDAGESWHSTIIPYQNLNAIHFINQNVGWIIGDSGLIIKTTDSGNTWLEQSGGQDYYLHDLHFFDEQTGIICGGTSGIGRLLRTTNGGIQWDEIALTNYPPRFLSIFFLNSNLGWVVGTGDQLNRTIDGGVSWDDIAYFGSGFTNFHYGIYFLDSLNGNACGWSTEGTGNTFGSIYKTSDGGYSWTGVLGVGYGSLNSLDYHTNTNSLYCVGNAGQYTIAGKIYKSTDGGNNWIEVSNPCSEKLTRITFTEQKGWIVGRNGTILSSAISSSVGGTDNLAEFNLTQNYPNPFNPVTKIKYQIPEISFVTITVYDVLGKEVATLVNEEKSAGEYEVQFAGTGLPSGIYFYQLQAGSFVETKKMVFLK